MAAEDQPPRAQANPEKTKKRKKTKKDKWGQPIAAAADEPAVQQVQEEPVAEAAAEEARQGEESYECGKVVASGMPYTTTEEEIRGLFDKFGPIRSLQLSRFPDSGNFRGLAFVTFESDEVAMKSLELDGHEIGNRFMRVERCRITASSKRQKKSEYQSDPEKPEGCLSAYVGNLSWNIAEKDLRDFFKSSRITSIRFAIDKRTGDSRGFCHVDFEDDESLENAVRMNQSELRGRPVKIAYAIINRN